MKYIHLSDGADREWSLQINSTSGHLPQWAMLREAFPCPRCSAMATDEFMNDIDGVPTRMWRCGCGCIVHYGGLEWTGEVKT